jgi:hypothetical protein
MIADQIPSLSLLLDENLTAEVVPGVVETDEYRLVYTFSLPSDEVAAMTAQEIYLLYFKPIIIGYFAPAINKLGRVCTRALSLPDARSKIIGFRCWKGKIPVNVYIARRQAPDRHQFILDAIVYPQPVENTDGEANNEA